MSSCVYARIGKETKALIEERAKKEGKTISEVVRDLIERGLEVKETPKEIHGFIDGHWLVPIEIVTPEGKKEKRIMTVTPSQAFLFAYAHHLKCDKCKDEFHKALEFLIKKM